MVAPSGEAPRDSDVECCSRCGCFCCCCSVVAIEKRQRQRRWRCFSFFFDFSRCCRCSAPLGHAQGARAMADRRAAHVQTTRRSRRRWQQWRFCILIVVPGGAPRRGAALAQQGRQEDSRGWQARPGRARAGRRGGEYRGVVLKFGSLRLMRWRTARNRGSEKRESNRLKPLERSTTAPKKNSTSFSFFSLPPSTKTRLKKTEPRRGPGLHLRPEARRRGEEGARSSSSSSCRQGRRRSCCCCCWRLLCSCASSFFLLFSRASSSPAAPAAAASRADAPGAPRRLR